MKENIKGTHLWLVFWKASRAVERVDRESIQKLEVGSVSEFVVLEILLHKGELPVSAIGKKVLLTSGSTTAAIDRLEKRGYVTRRHSDQDRRVVFVSLTKEGRDFIEAQFEQHAARLENIFSPLDSTEKETLLGLLKKVGKHAESL